VPKRGQVMSISEWLADQEWLPSALARLVDQRRPKTLASLRRTTAETEFQDAVAKILAEHPTGDDPASDRYQAHSFIQEQKISALFLKRWDADAMALGRSVMDERSDGGKKGGGKGNKALAEIWQKNATPTYLRLRAQFPKASASDMANRVILELGSKVPGKRSVQGWIGKVDRERRG
jgi:hypothetical protein